MWELYLLLLIQALSGVGLFVLLQKINKMKKQVDAITKEVENYISFVIEEEERTTEEFVGIKTGKKSRSDEAESSLIQAVLGDIFP